MTENNTDQSLSIDEFALRNSCSTRTVRRWMDAGELPDAFRDPFTNEWRFPINAVRQMRPKINGEVAGNGNALAFPGQAHGLPSSEVWFPHAAPVEEPEPTRLERLDDETSYLSIPDAARYLGIPQTRIRANPEEFGLKPFGINESLVVPKHVIRAIEGK